MGEEEMGGSHTSFWSVNQLLVNHSGKPVFVCFIKMLSFIVVRYCHLLAIVIL